MFVELGVIFLHVFYCMLSSKLWRRKKIQKFLRGCLANIQRHNTACSQNVKRLSLFASCLLFLSLFCFCFVFISLMSWVWRELIIVMLAQKKDKNIHSITTKFFSAFHQRLYFDFYNEECQNVKQTKWKCYFVHWLLASSVCLISAFFCFCFFLSTRHASLLTNRLNLM